MAGGAGGSRASDGGGAGGGMRSMHACVAKCERACLARACAHCLDRVSYLRRLKWAVINKILSTWADHGPS
jgi:hypothetical protein